MPCIKPQSQDFRSPLSRIKTQGNAHEGAQHWIGQRISAIALFPLGIFILGWIKIYAGGSYSLTINSLANPWVSGLTFLFITAASYHGSLGIQIVLEDYVHATGWRQWFLIKTKLVMVLLPIMSLFFLMKIMMLGMK